MDLRELYQELDGESFEIGNHVWTAVYDDMSDTIHYNCDAWCHGVTGTPYWEDININCEDRGFIPFVAYDEDGDEIFNMEVTINPITNIDYSQIKEQIGFVLRAVTSYFL